jgi:GTPase SAR1 family protein
MMEANSGPPSVMNLPPVVERIATQTEDNPAPICVLVVGMAGSGKTTLMAQLQQSTMVEEPEEEQQEQVVVQQEQQTEEEDSKPSATTNTTTSPSSKNMPAYCINLDPATLDVPYGASIDIRDTVDYKVNTTSRKVVSFQHSWNHSMSE